MNLNPLSWSTLLLMACAQGNAPSTLPAEPEPDARRGVVVDSAKLSDSAAPLDAGVACEWDLDCGEGGICEDGVCASAHVTIHDGGARPDGRVRVVDGRVMDEDVESPPLIDAAPRPEDRGVIIQDAERPDPCFSGGDGCPRLCAAPPCGEDCGDVNGDGRVDDCDARLIEALPLSFRLAVCGLVLGDVDQDGNLTGADAQRIRDGAQLSCLPLP